MGSWSSHHQKAQEDIKRNWKSCGNNQRQITNNEQRQLASTKSLGTNKNKRTAVAK